MTLSRPTILCCAIALFLFSCGKPLPEMTGLDLDAWKNDKNGCAGKRTKMIQGLEEQRSKLQGLSEMQIVDVLGRPDRTELYTRNQKFYFYWVEAGKDCGSDSTARRLSVRFNAVGLAKEVVVE